jgi:2'-5' RNA ligase
MRAFIAIPLPSAVQAAVALAIDNLAASGADVKWVAPQLLHLTLKFLGEITDEQRTGVEQVMRRVAAAEPAFQMDLAGLGAFPRMSAPQVVWVGIGAGRDAAARIAAALEQGCADALGMAGSGRRFTAHVTLGRVRRSREKLAALAGRLQRSAWEPPPAWSARSLVLYQSVLGRDGSTYTALAEAPLTATAGAS